MIVPDTVSDPGALSSTQTGSEHTSGDQYRPLPTRFAASGTVTEAGTANPMPVGSMEYPSDAGAKLTGGRTEREIRNVVRTASACGGIVSLNQATPGPRSVKEPPSGPTEAEVEGSVSHAMQFHTSGGGVGSCVQPQPTTTGAASQVVSVLLAPALFAPAVLVSAPLAPALLAPAALAPASPELAPAAFGATAWEEGG